MSTPVAEARLGTIARLAGPAIASLVVQTGVLWADRVMLGHHSATALAAMQIAGPVEWTLVSVASSFAVGTLALVGRARGAGDDDAARRYTTLSIVAALLVGLVVAALGWLVVLPSLPLLFPHAKAAVAVSREYLGVALLAAPFYCIGAAGFAALSASRDTMTPLRIGVVVNVVHIGVNWLLIDGHLGFPALGARGVGISTALSFVLEAALTLYVLRASLRPLDSPRAAEETRELFRVSVPATTERAIHQASYIAFVLMIARLGDDAMAANQALIAIEAISFMTVDGFATACGALVAQELGAGRRERAAWVGWASSSLAVATLSAFGLAFLVFRHRLPSLVTPRQDLQAVAAQAIVVMAVAQPFMAVGVVLGQAVRGAGATRVALMVSVVGGLGVRLLATWLATRAGLGVTGVWIGSTADWVVRTVLLVALWRGRLVRAG